VVKEEFIVTDHRSVVGDCGDVLPPLNALAGSTGRGALKLYKQVLDDGSVLRQASGIQIVLGRSVDILLGECRLSRQLLRVRLYNNYHVFAMVQTFVNIILGDWKPTPISVNLEYANILILLVAKSEYLNPFGGQILY